MPWAGGGPSELIPCSAMATTIARLADDTSQRSVPLLQQMLVGRASEHQLSIDDLRVSKHHAVLTCLGQFGWRVRDLGSKNGTRLGGRRLEPGEEQPLSNGETVEFGDRQITWRFHDGEAAQFLLYPETGSDQVGADVIASTESMVALSGIHDCSEVLLREGVDWYLEGIDGARRQLKQGELLRFEGRSYRFRCATTSLQQTETVAQVTGIRSLSAATVGLQVSRDEEHVSGVVCVGGETIQLPTRVHLYLLVLLARARRADREAGVEEGEAGWRYTDELLQWLDLDRGRLNLYVFRARQDFEGVGLRDFAGIIERRSMSKQMRIGLPPERVNLL